MGFVRRFISLVFGERFTGKRYFRPALCWCLLEDFYRADPSDVVPISLKPYHKPAAIARKMVPDCPSGQTVRFIREQIYFVDYGKKDPVTGLFSMNLFCPV